MQKTKKEKQQKGNRSLASFILHLFMQPKDLSLHGLYNLSKTIF